MAQVKADDVRKFEALLGAARTLFGRNQQERTREEGNPIKSRNAFLLAVRRPLKAPSLQDVEDAARKGTRMVDNSPWETLFVALDDLSDYDTPEPEAGA